MKSVGRVCRILLFAAGAMSLSAYAQNELGDIRFTMFGGPGYASPAAKTPFQAGFSMDQSLFPTRWKGAATGYLLEGGYLRPAVTGSGTAYLSADAMFSRYQMETDPRRLRYMPFAVAGYTRLINNAHAVNFGGGIDRALSDDRFWLRGEVRDELSAASGAPEPRLPRRSRV